MLLIKRLLILGLTLTGLAISPASAQIANRDARVTLNVAERTLENVVDFLRERSGANIEIIDTEKDVVSTLVIRSMELHDVHWKVALEIAAEKAGCVVEERRNGVIIVTKPAPFEFNSNGDTDIREIIELIAKVSGENIIVAPEVVGNLSVHFNGVPWRDALDVVAKTRGYTVVEERGGVLRVVDPLLLQDQLVTKSYQLRYLRPKGNYVPIIKSEFVEGNAKAPEGKENEHFSVLPALSKALSTAGALDYIEMQNVVIVRDTQQAHEQIREILGALDVEPMQVFCDVKFVSTSNGDLLNLGVDYGDAGPVVTMSGGQIPITLPFSPGQGGWDDSIIANNTGGGPWYSSDNSLGPSFNNGATFVPDTIYGALSFTQVTAALRLLQRDTSTEVIQAPKLIALDGREATIFVGETIRYAEAKSEQGQAGGLQLSVSEAANSPVEVGFQLLIKPHIVPGSDRIMMEVIPKETSLSGTGNSPLAPPGFDVFTLGASGLEGSIALPRTRSSTIVTTMMLDTGQTAVIGGLTTDSEVESETRVPGLWRIPLLGELFKYKEHNIQKQSLMVFLTPTIVHSREDQEAVLQSELSRRRSKLKDEIEALMNGDLDGAETGAGL
jgi:type IV pilus assembly protein PilQ